MKSLLLTISAMTLLSFSTMAESSYETYRLQYEADKMVIKLKGEEARDLYKQLVGPEVKTFTFPGFEEKLGEDMKCMKEGKTYSCEVTIDANGKAQTPANG
jgi:hypothetical protein